MRLPPGSVVFRLLVGVLVLEIAYVAYALTREDQPPIRRERLAHATPHVRPIRPELAMRPDAPKALPAISALTYIDDDTFTYDGHWEHVHGLRDGRRFGTSSRSFRPGDTATFSFPGRFVILFGIVGPGGGKATIEIDDGRERGTVSFHGRAKKLSALVYESSMMPAGAHRVKITVINSAHARGSSHGGYVNLDGAYYGN